MSRCPDTNVCESVIDGVIQAIGSILDVRVNFIANITETGFECMFGPDECTGNIQQLCVEKMYSQDNYTWWDFIQCEDQNQWNIPKDAQECAKTLNINWEQVYTCASGTQGKKLLTDSINYSKSHNATQSCTIRINNQPYCLYNNGNWVNCKGTDVQTIVNYVCTIYTGFQKPLACLPQDYTKLQNEVIEI